MVRFRRYKKYKKKSPPLSPIERLKKQIEQNSDISVKISYKKSLINETKLWLNKNKILYDKKKIELKKTQSEISASGFFEGLIEEFGIWTTKKSKALSRTRDKLMQDTSVYENKLRMLSEYKKELDVLNGDLNNLENLKDRLKILEEKRDISLRNKEKKEEEKREREIRKKEQEELLKAKAAAHDKKIRVRTESLKPKVLKEQLKISNHCPYCDILFEKGKAECDHIIPVSKGGLDRIQNLVYICVNCNRKKSTMTVRQFCKWANIDFDVVASKLEKLGKDV